jgi:hypothetical protein
MTVFTQFHDHKLHSLSLEKLMNRIIISFFSGIMLGEVVDLDLLDNVVPLPCMMPLLPWLPKLLSPKFHKMNTSISAALQQIKVSPRWSEIVRLADELQLTQDEAAKVIYTFISVSCQPLGNPMMNSLFLIPLANREGVDWLDDEKLLDSFCWELIRFSGPNVLMAMGKDEFIPTSSDELYHIKKGTIVLAHLGVVSRDENFWSEPSYFKAKRFVNSSLTQTTRDVENGSEPLPCTVFGCPLGQIEVGSSEDSLLKSHQLAFSVLAHPFIKEFVKIITKEFTWQLNKNAREALKGRNNSDKDFLKVSFEPRLIRDGSIFSLFRNDQIPLVEGVRIYFNSITTTRPSDIRHERLTDEVEPSSELDGLIFFGELS